MASIIDLDPRAIQSYNLNLTSKSVLNNPNMGGKSQLVAAMGDRFAIDAKVLTTNMRQGLKLASTLSQGLRDRAVLNLPDMQMNKNSGSPKLVDANGMTLVAKGFTAGYQAHQGQYFTIVHANTISNTTVNYLHRLTADVTANSTGYATMSFEPTLRQPPIANSTLLFDTPVIEGFLQGTSFSTQVAFTKTVSLSFVLTEAE